jgi:serine/threonine protein kinase
MFHSIRTKKPFFPDEKKHGIKMSEECKDFLTKCLQKKPADRLGTHGGIKEIMQHPWFSDIDVNALLARKIIPEFTPKLSQNILDVSNFDSMFTDLKL